MTVAHEPAPSTHNKSGSEWQAGGLSITSCGAVGDGTTSNTAAIQSAIDRCGRAGGGTVVVPPGKFLTGSLWMRSNVTLHLEAGSQLAAAHDVAEFRVWNSKWEGNVSRGHAALITGEGLTNVAITGRGTLDGRGWFWWDLFRQKKLQERRPDLFRLIDCKDVLLDGITCINSPMWTLVPTACDNVTISHVTLRNPSDSPNTDGINPDSCSNVHIDNCHIDVGDDCVTIKSGSEEEPRANRLPCQNITITNCTMLHGHGGVVMGSEMSGGVRNIAISNCVFSGTDRGIRLKSRRGRGNAIEDLRVDNIIMDEVLCAITVNLFYGCEAWGQPKVTDHSAQPVNAGTPQFRRLRFSNISARRIKYAGVFLLGLPEMFVEDVALDGISLYMDPENTSGGSPVMAPNIPDMCRAGVVVKNAHNVKLRRIDIKDQLGPAINIQNSTDVRVSDLHANPDGSNPIMTTDGKPTKPN
jgi:polygalacturonase